MSELNFYLSQTIRQVNWHTLNYCRYPCCSIIMAHNQNKHIIKMDIEMQCSVDKINVDNCSIRFTMFVERFASTFSHAFLCTRLKAPKLATSSTQFQSNLHSQAEVYPKYDVLMKGSCQYCIHIVYILLILNELKDLLQ